MRRVAGRTWLFLNESQGFYWSTDGFFEEFSSDSHSREGPKTGTRLLRKSGGDIGNGLGVPDAESDDKKLITISVEMFRAPPGGAPPRALVD
jgi:hypothetical protein